MGSLLLLSIICEGKQLVQMLLDILWSKTQTGLAIHSDFSV
jgi:hypothetical protein